MGCHVAKLSLFEIVHIVLVPNEKVVVMFWIGVKTRSYQSIRYIETIILTQ